MKTKSFIIVLLLISISCQDTTLDSEPSACIYQIPGCSPETNLKTISINPCFNYTFSDKLTIEFCVDGNYCPDKDRFLIQNNIYKDTITITITDTAKNLCKCIL